MKQVISKIKNEAYVECIIMLTIKSIATIASVTLIIFAITVLATILGELVWLIVPAR